MFYVFYRLLSMTHFREKGAFHLSKLTGQPIPIEMRISLLIKTNHPDQSNPRYDAQKEIVFQ